MRILTDHDVRTLLTPDRARAAMERAFRLRAEGALAAPPRFSVPSDGGRLVLTAGGAARGAGATGFRAYHTAPTAGEQLVAAFDGTSGELAGLVVGGLLGPLRTAAINAVAIGAMARVDARVLGILGTGQQATEHARAALAVHPFERVWVFSRDAARREAFARALAADTGVEARAAATAEEAVRAADVLITATDSAGPVLDAAWLRPGTHVNAVGPKQRGAAELPPEVGSMAARIATDSVEQLGAYPEPVFLADADRARVVGLERIVAGELPGRAGAGELTLFCSVGLAGTEVVLAEALLRQAEAARLPPPAVRLTPLQPAELDPYLDRLVPLYAADHVRVGNWPEAGARERARAQVAELLPQGVGTAGHELRHIEDAATGERVGSLWLALGQGASDGTAFIYDLWVEPRHRRRGFASAALAAAEARARRAGASKLGLHVFGDNVGARAARHPSAPRNATRHGSERLDAAQRIGTAHRHSPAYSSLSGPTSRAQ